MEEDKIIIGLTGRIASGKDTIGKYLSEEYSAQKIRFSTLLRDILEIIDLPDSRENMQDLSTILRKRFGENILAKAMMKLAKNTNNNLIVIDGVRRITDVENFKKLKKFFLIYIDVRQDNRYQRATARNENPGDDTLSREKFNKRDLAETEVQIESLKEKADFVIDNNGSLTETHEQIKKYIKDIV